MISKKSLSEIENNISYQIDYTANFNKSFRREHQAEFISKDLTADETAILFMIHFEPEISQSEIAQFLFKGKAHVGKILNDMESRGLLERIPDVKDNIIIKRNKITQKGYAYFEKGYTETQRIKKIMAEEFSQEEMQQFISHLKKFRKVLNSIVEVKLK